MPYEPFHLPWMNRPDTSTPVSAEALDHIEAGIVTAQETAESILLGGTLDISPDRAYKIVACTIRNTGDGFEFIDDDRHRPLGVSDVGVNAAGDIVITYDFVALRNAALLVGPDETFAAHGYTVGASVTLDECRIRVGRTYPMGDYISYSATNGWTSANGFGSIEVSPVANHRDQGYFVYSFNQPVGTPEVSTPVASPIIQSRTPEVSAYATSTVYHHRDPYPGEHGEMLFYFVDNATGEVIPNDAPDPNMQAYVMFNETTWRKVAEEELVSGTGNFWVLGLFEVEP